jgi:RNA polymerase sigma-70 factor (ECF subfamily)
LRLRVFRTTRDRARAEDVVRESLLRSWRNREVVDPTGGSGRGWPLTLPKRIAIHQWRSASRQPLVLTDHVPKRAVGDTGQQAVDRQLVHAALRTLSIEHRQTLFETYFRGASVTQAAETLGVSPGTVKSRTHYALHALRQAIDRMGGAA